MAVSRAETAADLLDDFVAELDALLAHDPHARETTLLIAPYCLGEFLDFNAFTDRVDKLVRKRGLEGTIQVASFHPRFQFAGTETDDITNCTNRSPYPTLHLLRESSIDRAVESFPDAASIYETNMETLRRLGPQGWAKLEVGRS